MTKSNPHCTFPPPPPPEEEEDGECEPVVGESDGEEADRLEPVVRDDDRTVFNSMMVSLASPLALL